MTLPVTLKHIKAAAGRIRPYAHPTPILTCAGLDTMSGGKLFFKCENFQKAGAFKFRGACNTILSISEREAAKGVATHSSGNHAAALALAARLRGIPAHIVMPHTAPEAKKAAVAGYGGIITFSDPTQESRRSTLESVLEQTGATYIPSYDDPRIVAGQGTAAAELIEEVPDLDLVIAPVGGGGLLSGTAIAVSELSPTTGVIGAEPVNADDAYRSLQEGSIVPSVNPQTIADGLLMGLSQLTFGVIRERVERIVTVSEEAIVNAMRHVWERMKIIIEPSSAVAVSAILGDELDVAGKRVGIILSGGNVDLERLPF
ncbi:MAG: pyridoxal-phosphate dependent enzyme [Fidelibacterota bacterium]|nr:MAG: pyridoxal-phosphate dependent enzyme [Candidatus Neomarinimicrobiota bacterium]